MMTRENELTKVTLLGSVGNLVLLSFKFVAGIVAGARRWWRTRSIPCRIL